ncbi:MAG: helix-hairpin-helix domain-containing protein [Pseudomonadota bacterium]|nr:helix-hairpin-helix domain-containing protein [Pseudomonadota bacterium]
MTPDRPVRASAFVGLLLTAGVLLGGPEPVDARVVQLVGVPSPGWYEADDLGAAARAAGGPPAHLAAGPIEDGDTVRLVSGWALPVRTLAPVATRVFGGRVSLNNATMADLEGLPGIGPALAARIVAGRPFGNLEDLDRIKGIGPAKLRALASLVAP